MPLASRIQITDQDIRSTSTTAGAEDLGQLAQTADGRIYAYGLNGSSSTALSPGKLAQGAKVVANHINRTGVTYAAGVNQVVFTLGNTAPTANQYNGGYFFVNAGTGAGQSMLIANHNVPAVSGATYPNFTVNLLDAILTATSVTDSKFSVIPHVNSAILIWDHTAPTANNPVGVPNISIPASSYGWFQCGGACSVLANGTPGIGVWVIGSATTDGAVDVYTNASTGPTVGYGLMTAVSTEYRMVYLAIGACA